MPGRKPSYHAELDVCIIRRVACEDKATRSRILVAVWRYNGGARKIQIQRQCWSKRLQDWRHSKVGRFSAGEWAGISAGVSRMLRDLEERAQALDPLAGGVGNGR